VQNIEHSTGRLAFVRSKISDLLQLASFQGTFSNDIKPHQLDRLRIAIVGRSNGATEEVNSLCSLAPFWVNDSTAAASCSEVASWILSSLSNETEPACSIPSTIGARAILRRVPTTQQSMVHRKTILMTEVDGGSLLVNDCVQSYIYILAHSRFASISGCSNCLVVIGATSAVVSVDNCENINFVGACGRITVSNTTDSSFHLCTNTPPVLHGDCRNVQFAPFNTFYPRLESDLNTAGIDPQKNEWDNLCIAFLPMDAQERMIGILPPEEFLPVAIPFGSIIGNANNPVPVPAQYVDALSRKQRAVLELKDKIVQMPMEEDTRQHMHQVIQARFKEWLIKSGNIRQVGDLVEMEGKNQQNTNHSTS